MEELGNCTRSISMLANFAQNSQGDWSNNEYFLSMGRSKMAEFDHTGSGAHKVWKRSLWTLVMYSGAPPYGHLSNTVTSWLRPAFFDPSKRPYISL